MKAGGGAPTDFSVRAYVGVQAFLSTSAGLIVGSDTDQLGHEYHARLGMFPPG